MKPDVVINKIEEVLLKQIDKVAYDTPIICFTKPLLKRYVSGTIRKCKDKWSKSLNIIADENGEIDIVAIIEELAQSLTEVKPFTLAGGEFGDIVIGNGNIKLGIPMTNKAISFNVRDIKEMLGDVSGVGGE